MENERQAQRLEEFALGRLAPDDLAALRAIATVEEFAAGAELLPWGASTRRLVITESGFVKVCRVRAGREAVLGVHGPGELLGEVALLDRGDHSASVVALTQVWALGVPTPAFWRLLAERPHLNRSIIGTVTTRLRDVSRQHAEQLGLASIQRLAARVLDLAARFGRPGDGEIVIAAPLTQAELSSWAGVSRETGVRGLRQLRDAGWIRLEHRRLIVIDLAALERFAGVADDTA